MLAQHAANTIAKSSRRGWRIDKPDDRIGGQRAATAVARPGYRLGGLLMRRLTWLVVTGALAVALSTVAAGPAGAAKGGNSDNAHACQQGGHENRFEAETGNPFKNAGDCASHGAKGGATASLQLATGIYPCDAGECWGTVSGSGLDPRADWTVTNQRGSGTQVASGKVDLNGNVAPTQAKLVCGAGGEPFKVQSLTTAGRPIFLNVNSPCG